MTIPARVRRKQGIREGDFLSMEEVEDGAIIMRLKKPLEPGRPVSSDEQRKILKDLGKLRENWR